MRSVLNASGEELPSRKNRVRLSLLHKNMITFAVRYANCNTQTATFPVRLYIGGLTPHRQRSIRKCWLNEEACALQCSEVGTQSITTRG